MKNTILSFAALAARILPASLKRALYGARPFARFIRNLLNKAAPSGLTQIQIAGGDLAGMTILLNLQSEKDYWLGNYEPELQLAVRRFVRPGVVVYDVGANIGYVSMLFARAVGKSGKVYAFEALPANLERLRSNIKLNSDLAQIIPVEGAVSNSLEAVDFMVHASGSMGKAAGSAGRHNETYLKQISVPGVMLDDFIFNHKNPSPQVVKLDIEGGEVMAIPGMQRMLSELHPFMFVELHGPEAAHVVCESLWANGYEIRGMSADYPLIETLGQLDWKSYIIAQDRTFKEK